MAAAGLAGLAVVPLTSPPTVAAPAGAPRLAEKVLVLSLPSLDWPTVVAEQPAALVALLERSAVGTLSVRTFGPTTSAGEAYATVGAGSRATADGGTEPAVMVGPDAGSSGYLDRLAASCGCSLAGWRILQPGAAAIQAANEELLYGARPGALGDALAGSGRRTAVVGNADTASPTGDVQRHREAVLALMDGHGRVADGSIGPEVSTLDPSAPGGLRSDIDATVAAFRRAWSDADVVLLHAGDLARADVADPARRSALASADRLVGLALSDVDLDRHLVVVVAPTSGRPGGDGLTLAAVAGPGVAPGLATSASTRRRGYVTLPDVAPTVLAAMGSVVPGHMTGAPIQAGAALEPSSFAGRSAALAGIDTLTSFRDRAVGPVSVAFVVVQVLAYVLAMGAAVRWPALRPNAAFVALVTLAVPPLAFLSGLVPYASLGIVGYPVVLFLAAAALAAGALALASVTRHATGRASALVAPLVLVGLSVVVLVVDVLTGARLQLNTVFGYSPTVAGRFTGYGNLAFALLSAGAVVIVTGGWAVASLLRGRPGRFGLVAAVAVFAAVVIADGHPSLGADVGGVLALVPAAIVVVGLLAGRRLSIRLGAAIAAATVVVLGAFVAVDLARPADARTHLGRTAASFFGDASAMTAIVERKARANVAILTSSPWVLAIPAVLLGCAVLVWRRPPALRRMEAQVPGLRACLVGALVLGVAGGAFNDSGAAVPAMMMAVVLPYVTVLATARR